MEPLFLDSSFKEIYIADVYKSLLWVDRYNSYGDFELVLNPDLDILSHLLDTKYVKLKESEHLMFMEDVNIKTDSKSGSELLISGRSVESMLDRRIIWDPDNYFGNLQDQIYHMLNVNIINVTPASRQVSNLVFEASTNKYITDINIEEQYFGQEIYKVVETLCKRFSIGFKITLNSSNEFVFNLYYGEDRSFNQSNNEFVIFSPRFDNLKEANYIKTDRFLKNVAFVAGERGVANTQLTQQVYIGSPTGLDRREMFFEANDVKRQSPGTIITDSEYVELLASRGYEELAKNKIIEAVDGEVDASLYTVGVDFDLGDVVQLEDSYGHLSKSRIVEIVYSKDSVGKKTIPIFAAI